MTKDLLNVSYNTIHNGLHYSIDKNDQYSRRGGCPVWLRHLGKKFDK